MIAIAALVLDLAAHGRAVTLAPGQALVLRLPCGPEEWWSFDYDPGVIGRDHLADYEALPGGATQVETFHARKPGTARIRARRAAGTWPPTGEFVLTVEVRE